MIWLIIAAVLFLIACIPLGLHITYDEHGTAVLALVGPVRFAVYPKKVRNKKNTTKKSTGNTGQKLKNKVSKGGSFRDFLPIIKVILELLHDLRKKIIVSNLIMKITMAGGDPCDLAINYGRSWGALGALMPRLEQFLHIRKRDLSISCDFEGSETTVYFFAAMRISLFRALYLVSRYGVRAAIEYMKLMNSKKGGAKV